MDADGLPTGFDPATETLITPTVPIRLGQRLFTVAPTKDDSSDRLSDIAISGFVFDGKAAAVASGGDAIFVDRVSNFSIHYNVTQRVRIGIWTRLSSGRIYKNFHYNSNDGISVSGGSEIYPATVRISSNRAINNVEQGAVAVGTGIVREAGGRDPTSRSSRHYMIRRNIRSRFQTNSFLT